MKELLIKGLISLGLTLLICGLVLTPTGKLWADDLDPDTTCTDLHCDNGCYASTTLCLSIPENSTGCTSASECNCKCEFFLILNKTQCLCTMIVPPGGP